MRSHVIFAVFKRNVASYFSGMLGYLFIVVFVVAGAFLAFDNQFFADNLANLDRLSERFPLLLLFIIPAITMTAWADEKKLGTDELLFTLPGSDAEILLGKYFAVLAVYTVALVFSFTHALVLAWLGNPDWGLIMTTYLGYWFAGAALLSAGMFASVLTSSATVAFVLGAAICAIPVFIDEIPGIQTLLKDVLNIREPLSVAGQLRGFTSGQVTLSGLFYFIGLTAFFLYLNAVMIARRHWAGGKQAGRMTGHFVMRTVCLAVAILSFTYTLAVAGTSIDTTVERLHTLSSTTLQIIDDIPENKTVTIQAFLSPDVPQDFVPVRKELIDKLREYDKRGGSKIVVRFVDVKPYSREAEEADSLGVERQQIQSQEDGRFTTDDVYLGVVITSGFDTIVVPFFSLGTPIEYELTRSIGTASQEQRLSVGILKTDAQVNGGFDSSSFQQLPKWQLVQELSKQYDIKDVSPDEPITTEMDVLIAILPSSLTQPQMANLVAYVKQGKPVLIFDDPAPIWGSRFASGISWAPLEPKPSPGGGMMMMQQNQAPPKADQGEATSLSAALGIRWNVHKSLFDIFTVHPNLQTLPDEFIFERRVDGNFNPQQPVIADLEEIILAAPGVINKSNDAIKFTKLMESRGPTTGLNDWADLVQASFFGKNYNLDAPQKLDDEKYTLAALIEADTANMKVHAIFVADVDIVNDIMFSLWQQPQMGIVADNTLFVLNCVDHLAGDDRYLQLRSRHAQHRTLTTLEQQKVQFELRRSAETEKANTEAEQNIADAKLRLQKVVDNLRKEVEQGNVDSRTATARLQNAEQAEQRKLSQQEKEIEREKNERIRHVRTETEQEIRAIEQGFWRWAVLIPPLPALILGIVVLLMRVSNERQGVASDRIRQ